MQKYIVMSTQHLESKWRNFVEIWTLTKWHRHLVDKILAWNVLKFIHSNVKITRALFSSDFVNRHVQFFQQKNLLVIIHIKSFYTILSLVFGETSQLSQLSLKIISQQPPVNVWDVRDSKIKITEKLPTNDEGKSHLA